MRVVSIAHDRKLKARRGALLALVLVAATVVAAFASRGQSLEKARSDDTLAAIRIETPLGGGRKVSLDEAVRSFGLPVFRPFAPEASDQTIDELWMRTEGSKKIYITYASGLVVTVRPASDGEPTAAYAAAQIRDGVPGTIVDLGKVQAFEVPQSKEGDLGSLRMVLDDAIVTLIGHGDFPTGALRSIGQSVVANEDLVKQEFAANQRT